jgi:hypothetical protein
VARRVSGEDHLALATAAIALLLNWNSGVPTRRRDAVSAGLLSKAYVLTPIPAAGGRVALWLVGMAAVPAISGVLVSRRDS